jgi:hypothetical protein
MARAPFLTHTRGDHSSAAQQGTNPFEAHSLSMDGDRTIGPLAMRRIGEAFRRVCGIPRKLPFRLYDLVAQLRRATKGDDYRHNAAELMRLADHAKSPAEKTRLVTLAEGWVELAEKAHKDNRREPTILNLSSRRRWASSRTRVCEEAYRAHDPNIPSKGAFGTKGPPQASSGQAATRWPCEPIALPWFWQTEGEPNARSDRHGHVRRHPPPVRPG